MVNVKSFMASEKPKNNVRTKKSLLAVGGALVAAGTAGYLALNNGDPEKVNAAQENTQKKAEDVLKETPEAHLPPHLKVKSSSKLNITKPPAEPPQEKIDETNAPRLFREGNHEAIRWLLKEIATALKEFRTITPFEKWSYEKEEDYIQKKYGITTAEAAIAKRAIQILDYYGDALNLSKDESERDKAWLLMMDTIQDQVEKFGPYDELFLHTLDMTQSELKDFVREACDYTEKYIAHKTIEHLVEWENGSIYQVFRPEYMNNMISILRDQYEIE